MTAKRDISGLIVSTDVMASLLGFTRQRINQLAKEGILEKKSAGHYPLVENVQKYIDHLRAGLRAGASAGHDDEDQARYWEEKALHEKAKRETTEIKLAKLKHQMHDAADVELVLTNMLVTFRNRILSIPDKIAPKVIGLKTLSEISDIINIEVLEALTELSEYDPLMFAGVGDDEAEDSEPVSKDTEGSSSTSEADD